MTEGTARNQFLTISRASLWLYENLGKALNQGEGFYPTIWAEAIKKLQTLERLLGKDNPRITCHWEPLTNAATAWLSGEIARASQVRIVTARAREEVKARLGNPSHSLWIIP